MGHFNRGWHTYKSCIMIFKIFVFLLFASINERINAQIDGAWGSWQSWSPCDPVKDQRERNRTCDSPPPSDGGSPCPGLSVEEECCPEQPGGKSVCECWNKNVGDSCEKESCKLGRRGCVENGETAHCVEMPTGASLITLGGVEITQPGYS